MTHSSVSPVVSWFGFVSFSTNRRMGFCHDWTKYVNKESAVWCAIVCSLQEKLALHSQWRASFSLSKQTIVGIRWNPKVVWWRVLSSCAQHTFSSGWMPGQCWQALATLPTASTCMLGEYQIEIYWLSLTEPSLRGSRKAWGQRSTYLCGSMQGGKSIWYYTADRCLCVGQREWRNSHIYYAQWNLSIGTIFRTIKGGQSAQVIL